MRSLRGMDGEMPDPRICVNSYDRPLYGLMPNHYHLVIETRIGLGTLKGANANLHRYMHQSLAPDSNPAQLGL